MSRISRITSSEIRGQDKENEKELFHTETPNFSGVLICKSSLLLPFKNPFFPSVFLLISNGRCFSFLFLFFHFFLWQFSVVYWPNRAASVSPCSLCFRPLFISQICPVKNPMPLRNSPTFKGFSSPWWHSLWNFWDFSWRFVSSLPYFPFNLNTFLFYVLDLFFFFSVLLCVFSSWCFHFPF